MNSKPYLIRTASNSNEMFVSSCSFNSPSDVRNFTYLIVTSKDNSTKRIDNTQFTSCNSTGGNTIDCFRLTSFDEVDIWYQCGVFVHGLMRQPLLSERTKISIPPFSCKYLYIIFTIDYYNGNIAIISKYSHALI